MLLGMTLLLAWVAGALAATPIEQAREEIQRFPQDYGAWVALARLAEAEADWTLAGQAWQLASLLSGGSVEALTGQARVALAADDRPLARSASAQAINAAPTLAYAWQLRAEALRRPLAGQSEAQAWAQAHSAARSGLALDPDDPYGRCELAWSRWRIGDARGARQLFDKVDHPCAQAGLASVPSGPVAWAALWGGLQAYPGSSRVTGSGLGGLSLGASLGDRWDVDAVGRLGRLGLSDGFSAATADWRELWTGLGLRRGHLRAGLVLGGIWTDWPAPPAGPGPGGPGGPGGPSGSVGTETSASRFAGLSLQAGNWPTARLSAALSGYDDGWAWQSEAGLNVPATRILDVQGGLRLGGFAWQPGGALARSDVSSVDPAADGRVQLSGQLGGRLHGEGWSVRLSGRLGPELRPLRVDERVSWSLNRRVQGALDAGLAVRLGTGIWLQTRYTGLRLPAVSDALSEAARLHSLNLGISARIPGQSP